MRKLLIALTVLFLAANCCALELVRQKNVATVIMFPLIDSTTTTALQSSATALDSEIDQWSDSADNPDGFADCTNEATEVGATGQYYLILTQSEMNENYIIVQIKASDALTQVILIRTTIGDPLNCATTDDGGTINVTGGAIDTTTTNSDMVGEPSTALAAIKLDHLMNIAVDTNFQTTVHDDSVLGYMTTSSGTADYVRTEDSLEDLRDRGDAAWDTATGFAVSGEPLTAQEVEDECVDALESFNLDHLVKLAVDTNYQTTVHNDSVIGYMTTSSATTDYVRTEDSLEDLRDRGDGAWITATGFSTHDAAAVKTAIEADGSKIDHLWEMTEDDGGVRRLTTNALEQGPSGGATAQEFWEYDISAIANTDQSGGVLIWMFNLGEGDEYIDTTQTPWQWVKNKKGTPGTEYLRKDLFDVSGGNVTSTSTVIGKQTEP